MKGIIEKILRPKRAVNLEEKLHVNDEFLVNPDFHHSDFINNPFVFFKALRADAPVKRNLSGVWMLSSYELIKEALSHESLSNEPPPYAVLNCRNKDKYICADVAKNIIPFQFGEQHTENRRQIGRNFSELLKSKDLDLQSIAAEIFEPLKQKNRMDLLSEFCTPFTIAVLSEIFGQELKSCAELKGWCDNFFYLFSIIPDNETRENLDKQLTQFREYLDTVYKNREVDQINDGIDIFLSGDSMQMELTQKLDNIMLLLADGINVDYGIANSLLLLLQHPDQLKLIIEDSELIPACVEESLRYESPSLFIGRTAVQDLVLADQTIKKGSALLLMLGSANRDEAYFDHADQYVIKREKQSIISFGRGAHTCLGQQLAKQMMISTLKVLSTELGKMKLSGDVVWQSRAGHRWLTSLVVDKS